MYVLLLWVVLSYHSIYIVLYFFHLLCNLTESINTLPSLSDTHKLCFSSLYWLTVIPFYRKDPSFLVSRIYLILHIPPFFSALSVTRRRRLFSDLYFTAFPSFLLSCLIISPVTQGFRTSALVLCSSVSSVALVTVDIRCSHLPFTSALSCFSATTAVSISHL